MRTPVGTCPDPAQLAVRDRRGRRSYASPALLRWLAGAMLLVSVVAPLYGVVYAVNGATRAGAPVAVSVTIRDLDRLQVQQATTVNGAETDLPLKLEQGQGLQPGLILYIDGAGKNSWLQAGTGPVALLSSGSTVAEWLAGRGGLAVAGVCAGLGALLLRRLLLSIGAGRPFQPGNAARVAAIAGLLAAATIAAGVLPYVAARLVLGRLGLGGPGSPVAAHLAVPGAPLLLAVFLMAVAEAFRRGSDLAKDAEGLI
jgi:Protein of unknown function (DUF2975)